MVRPGYPAPHGLPPPPTPPDLIRAFLAGRDEPCPKCGYNLRDAKAAVCPECGAPMRLMLERIAMPRVAVRLAVAALCIDLLWNVFMVWDWAGPIRLALARGTSATRWRLLEPIAEDIAFAAWALTWLIVGFWQRRRGPRGKAGRSLVAAALWLMAFRGAVWLVKGLWSAWQGV